MASILQPLGDGLWTVRQPFRLLSIPIGIRMMVVQRPGGGLLLHSPVRLDEPLRDALAGLGPVEVLVAPNLYHHLFLRDASLRYPEAAVVAPRGLDAKMTTSVDYEPIDETQRLEPFNEVLDRVDIEGIPRLRESAFLHRPSRTLILTDLLFNLGQVPGPYSWLITTLFGINGPHRASRLVRFSLLNDRDAFTGSMERILALEFDRISVAHGEIIDGNVKAILKQAYAKSLRPLASTSSAP